MKCPSCGYPRNHEDKFCHQCGTQLNHDQDKHEPSNNQEAEQEHAEQAAQGEQIEELRNQHSYGNMDEDADIQQTQTKSIRCPSCDHVMKMSSTTHLYRFCEDCGNSMRTAHALPRPEPRRESDADMWSKAAQASSTSDDACSSESTTPHLRHRLHKRSRVPKDKHRGKKQSRHQKPSHASPSVRKHTRHGSSGGTSPVARIPVTVPSSDSDIQDKDTSKLVQKMRSSASQRSESMTSQATQLHSLKPPSQHQAPGRSPSQVLTFQRKSTSTARTFPPPLDDPDRVWLSTKFAEKDTVKALGARWDPLQCKWWVGASASNMSSFEQWIISPQASLEKLQSQTQ